MRNEFGFRVPGKEGRNGDRKGVWRGGRMGVEWLQKNSAKRSLIRGVLRNFDLALYNPKEDIVERKDLVQQQPMKTKFWLQNFGI